MTSQVIPVCTSVLQTPFELKDRFRYRPDRGWLLVQRLCFWILDKLGCYAIDHKVEFRSVRIEGDKLLQGLMRQQENLIQHYHVHGERVLVGSKQFCEIMNDEYLNQPINFEVPYWVTEGRGDKYTLAGMKVSVIPWMEGILVMPKEIV